jgi:hypothetical protein
MSLTDPHGNHGAKTGISRNGNVRHIIDVNASEFLKKQNNTAFCGAHIVQANSNSDLKLCRNCVISVRRIDQELRKLNDLPNQEEINKCLNLILSESNPPLAQVIYLFQRKN